MKKYFMIDLETMGIRPTSAILSVGVVYFDRDNILDTFYSNVNLADCMSHGLTTDKSTMDWWNRPDLAEARKAWDTPEAPTLRDAMTGLCKFISGHAFIAEVCPWGNGADFDQPIIGNAFYALDADLPWKFYNSHCFRTLKNLYPPAFKPRSGTHHNALDDAISQVKQLHEIIRTHKLTCI